MNRTWRLAWLPPLLAHVVGSGPVPIQRLLLVGGALAGLNLGIMFFLQGRAERAARDDDPPAAADAPSGDRKPSRGARLIATERRRPRGSELAGDQAPPSESPASDRAAAP